jgi:hypothetical protein
VLLHPDRRQIAFVVSVGFRQKTVVELGGFWQTKKAAVACSSEKFAHPGICLSKIGTVFCPHESYRECDLRLLKGSKEERVRIPGVEETRGGNFQQTHLPFKNRTHILRV